MLEPTNSSAVAVATDDALARRLAPFLDAGDPGQADDRAIDDELDSELQAAIEYKIAISGAAGAAVVLDLLNAALRRSMR